MSVAVRPVRPRRSRPRRATPEPPPVVDLLLDGSELLALLDAAAAREDAVDAFLCAAALDQVASDYLDRDPWSLGKVAGLLDGASPALAAAARAVRMLGRWVAGMREWTPRHRRLRRAGRPLRALVDRLAAAVIDSPADWTLVRAEWSGVRNDLHHVTGFAREVVRLPSCFRDLDQRPIDVVRLARHADMQLPAAPVVVVGVRTSGSYLAPLLRAALVAGGREARVSTVRPGRALAREDLRRLRREAAAGWACVIVDDPPSTGGALRRAARLLQDQGFATDRTLIAIATLEPSLPPALDGFRVAALPYAEWQIHVALEERAVKASLERLLAGREITVRGARVPVDAVLHVSRWPASDCGRAQRTRRPRRHAEAVYHAVLLSDGAKVDLFVRARGCAPGYLGRHALAVAARLTGLVPEHYGIDNDLLFCEWVEGGIGARSAGPTVDERLAAGILRYVEARATGLPAAYDKSRLLVGRNPVWQRAADVLAARYRGLRPAVRIPMHRVARRLLQPSRPAVTDGDMGPARWFWTSEAGRLDGLVKARPDELAFSNEDLACYDPDFDLAAAAVAFDTSGPIRGDVGERLRAAAADDERWTLYRLERLADTSRGLRIDHSEAPGDEKAAIADRLALVEAEQERTVGEYVGRRLAALPPATGALCAIDVDGVLEADGGGHSAVTPAGVAALRALAAHGFRPVIVSGRSVRDVEWRCAAYGAAAGVAEYGSALCLPGRGDPVDLLGDEWRAPVRELGERLRWMGVTVAPGTRWIVRASVRTEEGRQVAPPPDVIARALEGFERAFRAVEGWSQTDLVPAGADKDGGLAALADLLDAPGYQGARVALAVGDSRSDLSMLRMARHAAAPANGRAGLGSEPGIQVGRHEYQRGLGEAVKLLIGHTPGRCPMCRPARTGRAAKLLLGVLGSRDVPRSLRLAHAAWLMGLAGR